MVGAEDGKRVGNPELVRQNLGNADPITITDDGSIYYREQNSAAGTELWMMEGFLAKKPLQNKRLLVGIPLEFVLNGDSAILDRKFNFSATLPARWTIQGAGRDVSGIANVIRFIASDVPESISQFKNYSGQLNYWSGTPGALSTDSPESWTNALGPKPITSTELDAWLRNYARLWDKQRNNNQIFTFGYSDYKHRPESIVLRTIGGHRAVTWTADFTRNNPGWTEFITVIYGEKVMARFTAWVPAAKIDALRPGYESLAESIRLP